MLSRESKTMTRGLAAILNIRFILGVGLSAALIVSFLASPTTPVAAQAGPANQFTQMGMHIPQAKDGVWPDVPIGSIRLWDTGVSWREINTAPGVYDWSTLDGVIDLANSKGAKVLYVFGNTPAWAAEPRCLAAQGGAIKGAGANCPPANMSSFVDFAREIAKKYGSRIESYELWNEGNIGTFWRGTPLELATMTIQAAAAIKAVNSQAKIVSASVTTRLGTASYIFLPEYAKALAAAKWPIDAFAIHTYPAGSYPACTNAKGLGFSLEVVCDKAITPTGASAEWHQVMHHLLQRENSVRFFNFSLRSLFGMPDRVEIWDTELNYGLAGPGDIPAQSFSEDAQATLLNASYVQSKQFGVARTYWFAWGPKDQAGVVQFGVTTDFGTKPAQAFARYWQWITNGLMDPGPRVFNGQISSQGEIGASVSYLGKVGSTTTYWLTNPIAGLSYGFPAKRFMWPAVGPCRVIDPGFAVSAESLGQYPYIWSTNPIPGC
jgi:hypothetical protein